jgi:hypothetical protein
VALASEVTIAPGGGGGAIAAADGALVAFCGHGWRAVPAGKRAVLTRFPNRRTAGPVALLGAPIMRRTRLTMNAVVPLLLPNTMPMAGGSANADSGATRSISFRAGKSDLPMLLPCVASSS